jgi:ESS family glutamate:Na+ symporter
MSSFEFDTMEMLAISIGVLFLGMFLNRKVRFLGDNYIPPAVTGGLLFAVGTMLVYYVVDLEVSFDMRLRDLLLLVFFSTVGLSARLQSLAAGGKALAILTVVAAVFLVVQNTLGIAIAMLGDYRPAYGLMAGSVSFAGGHGTAIAWGQVAEDAGLEGAIGLGMAFATFGLVAGGLVGGPVARRLIARTALPQGAASSALDPGDVEAEARTQDWLYSVLSALFVIALCVSLGEAVNQWLLGGGFRLPGFLTAMFVGIVITNSMDFMKKPLQTAVLDRFGEVSLNIFLAMSMMAIQLWTLASAFAVITIVLLAQVLLMTVFAVLIVYRVMGRDYDAVVIASGFTGLGLGATPVAIANMDAVTARYGPSTKAFLVVPLVGAFFIDLLNAGTINFFIRLLGG